MRSHHFSVLLSTLVLSTAAKKISRLFEDSLSFEVGASPFQVELLASPNSTNVRAVITNRGSVPAYYPLSTEELVTKLQLYNENDEPVAMADGTHTHSHTVQSPSEYEKLAAGFSVTRDFDIAAHYQLSAGQQYYIQAGGFVSFYNEGQLPESAKFQSQIFEAAVLPFEAPADLPARVSRLSQGYQSPNIVVATCSDAEMNDKLIKAVPHALLQIRKSIEYIKTGKDRTIMLNFFKADDEQTKGLVLARFQAMAKALESTTGPGRLQCGDSNRQDASWCSMSGAVAMTDAQSGKVTICAMSKRYTVEFKRCGDSNWGGNILHELTHSQVIYKPNTVDITYTLAGCKGLTTQRALQNAANFNFLADSVMQGKSC